MNSRTFILVAIAFAIVAGCSSRKSQSRSLPDAATSKPSQSRPFNPTGCLLPETAITISSYTIDYLRLVVGYEYMDGRPCPPFATCVITDSTLAKHRRIVLEADSTIVTADTLFIQFHHPNIGQIRVAGRFLVTTGSFASMGDGIPSQEGNLVISPWFTVFGKGDSMLHRMVNLRYTNEIDED